MPPGQRKGDSLMTPYEFYAALDGSDPLHSDDIEDLEATVEKLHIAVAHLLNQLQLDSPFMVSVAKSIAEKARRKSTSPMGPSSVVRKGVTVRSVWSSITQ